MTAIPAGRRSLARKRKRNDRLGSHVVVRAIEEDGCVLGEILRLEHVGQIKR